MRLHRAERLLVQGRRAAESAQPRHAAYRLQESLRAGVGYGAHREGGVGHELDQHTATARHHHGPERRVIEAAHHHFGTARRHRLNDDLGQTLAERFGELGVSPPYVLCRAERARIGPPLSLALSEVPRRELWGAPEWRCRGTFDNET